MKISEKIQILRKEKRLSQEGLAEILNVSRQAVSKWESGQSYPEIDKLIGLSNIFDITLDDLIKDNIEFLDNRKENNNNKEDKVNIETKNEVLNEKSIIKEDKEIIIREKGSFKRLLEKINNTNKKTNEDLDEEDNEEDDIISTLMLIAFIIGEIIFFASGNTTFLFIGPLIGFLLYYIYTLYLELKKKEEK